MKIIIALSVVVLVGCGASDRSGGDRQVEPTQTTSSTRASAPAELGESRRDTGHPYYPEVAFTVLKVSESAELPTDDPSCPPTVSASNGKWVVVQVKAVNEGTEPVVLATNHGQSLYDGDRWYESEPNPWGNCAPTGLFGSKLQPGDQVIGIYVWDVRSDVTPDRVELIVTDRHSIDREASGALFSLR